jgi:tartrate dehydrogenase/decarboxylase/D-malate dehydrogenase
MLAHLGYPQAHDAIVQAIEHVLEPASGGPRTPDLGGRAHTVDLGLAIAEAISAR